MKGITTVLAACAAAALVSPANADVINISGFQGGSTEGLANFMGTLNYTPVTANTGQLVVSLTNTTPANIGGFLTGFVFNINSPDTNRSATLTAQTFPFQNLPGPVTGSPFGTFDGGAALGGSFEGGGSPNAGVPVGQTGVFTFTVNASNAGALTASSFITGPNQFDFVVRFRGLSNDGSDKVPVPAPGAVAVLGLAGLAAARRRR